MSNGKEEFEEWYKSHSKEWSAVRRQSKWDSEQAWNHQQKKIDDLTEQGVADIAIREKLLHENKELREALEFYADPYNYTPNRDAMYGKNLNEKAWQTLAKYEKGEG